MKRHIPLGHMNISDNAKKYVLDALDHNRLSSGKYIQQFEHQFAKKHQRQTSVFTASGTCALQIALAALKEKHGYADGDEVLVPAITFVATSNIVIQLNMKPVFVDVDPYTYNINPREIEKHITGRTRVIIPVHLFGLPCDMDPIMEIAGRHKLQVIEDSCETMFVHYKGRSVGTFGDYACFSTYVAHLLITGVGGVITMKDESDEKLLRSIMQHGRDTIYLNIDDDDELDDAFMESLVQRRFSFVRMGYSYRITELEGALGVAALEETGQMMLHRKTIGEAYTRALSQYEDALQLPYIPEGHEHAYMMYPIVLKRGNRDDYAMFLEKNGVETRYMMPLLNQPYYKQQFGNIEDSYPAAKHINHNGLYIPCHQGMELADVDYVSELTATYLKGEKWR
ncbi:DegT/DnrJ/EryC1/StrS family aminotransferase [Paenibacillus protaetiae]|uniref:DegT/DnrJ/EryC1/StrS family aminotransferase n=1 Tax=Paenibacillus protaetiae TaxID=2509456 RepID=A0A4P6ERL3_9BACL|nr:DegT/DnrJ/EryC1/StrS family aminotransferase [Paenibacillus protaetiae]QAY65542.1 DegT/DnrJ/EryC1/StrS family aminotransferase [Paenibacillus protaetiae]